MSNSMKEKYVFYSQLYPSAQQNSWLIVETKHIFDE